MERANAPAGNAAASDAAAVDRIAAAASAVANHAAAGQAETPRPATPVQRLKLQLFHRLQRRHRDAWKRYWGAFQSYLAAQLSLQEFHALAEELLGPDKHLHNRFVVALLDCAHQQSEDAGATGQSRHEPRDRQEAKSDVGGDNAASSKAVAKTDPLIQIIREERERRHSTTPNDQQADGKQHADLDAAMRRKRPHSSITAGSGSSPDNHAVHKLLHLASGNEDTSSSATGIPHATVTDTSGHVEEHPDHQSAKLLMGLGMYTATISPSSALVTPEAGSSTGGFDSKDARSDGFRHNQDDRRGQREEDDDNHRM